VVASAKRAKQRSHPAGPFSILDTDPPPVAMFRLYDRWEWILCDEAPFETFAVYVRTSISNDEQEHLRRRHDQLRQEYTEAWNALPPEQRDMGDSPHDRELAMLAPYVRAWTAQARDLDTGEWVNVPPPADVGRDAFRAIPDELTSWIVRLVLEGYMIAGKAVVLRKPSRNTGVSSSPQQNPEDESPMDSTTGPTPQDPSNTPSPSDSTD
jgi:hypothetical protein